MKKILIILLFPVVCLGQKISSLPTQTTITNGMMFPCNSGTTPDTTKKMYGQTLIEKISDIINDTITARGVVVPTDNVLDWQINKYMLYPSRSAKGIAYRGSTYPNSNDSAWNWNGVHRANSYETSGVSGQGYYALSGGINYSQILSSGISSIGTSGTANLSHSSIDITNGLNVISSSSGTLQIGYNSNNYLVMSPYTFPSFNFPAYVFNSVLNISPSNYLLSMADSNITRFSINGDGNVIMNGLESNTGKYNLTLNSATKEIYAQELAHAFLGFDDSTRSMTLTSNASWYKVGSTGWSMCNFIESDGIDSIGKDTFQIKRNAHWQIHYHVNFIGSSGVYYKARVFNVTKNRYIPFQNATTASGAGNIVNVGNTAYCDFCTSNDKLILQMQAEANTETITLKGVSVLIIATHGTQ